MIDLTTYALLRKQITSAVSGVSDVRAEGDELIFVLEDGREVRVAIPATEIRDAVVRDDVLVLTLEDDKEVVVDATLTKEGQAADAKATGGAISQLKDDLSNETIRATNRENEIESLFTMPTQEAVNKWLNDHPEATTTVQDGSINEEKFTNVLRKKKANYYISVEKMKEDASLIVGTVCVTLGYYEPNDGGGATYMIREKKTSDVDDGGFVHFLMDDLVAELIVGLKINAEQLGIVGDEPNNSLLLQKFIDNYPNIEIHFSEGTYVFTDDIVFSSTSFVKIIGHGYCYLNYIGNGTFFTLNGKQIRFENIGLRGLGKEKNQIGIRLGDKSKLSYIMDSYFENVRIVNFNVGLLSDYAWKINFVNLFCVGSNICVKIDYLNASVFMSLNCENCDNGLLINDCNGVTFVTPCIEGCSESHCVINNGRGIEIDNPYFESSIGYICDYIYTSDNADVVIKNGTYSYGNLLNLGKRTQFDVAKAFIKASDRIIESARCFKHYSNFINCRYSSRWFCKNIEDFVADNFNTTSVEKRFISKDGSFMINNFTDENLTNLPSYKFANTNETNVKYLDILIREDLLPKTGTIIFDLILNKRIVVSDRRSVCIEPDKIVMNDYSVENIGYNREKIFEFDQIQFSFEFDKTVMEVIDGYCRFRFGNFHSDVSPVISTINGIAVYDDSFSV